jgi:3-hydroxypropanoate dehydrogenase
MTATTESTSPGVPVSRAIDAQTASLLFHDAHTAYGFTDAPVSDAELAELYGLMRFGPTAMNSQPLRITFIRSDEAKARLLPLLAEGNRPKSLSAPVVAILAADSDFHEHLARFLPQVPGAKVKFADDAARTHAALFNATLQAGTGLESLLVVNLGHIAEGADNPRNPRHAYDEAVTVL